MTEAHDRDYPDEFDESPPDPTWTDEIESYVVRVRRYDKNDVLLGTQYFMVVEDTKHGSHMVSSILCPAEPEADA